MRWLWLPWRRRGIAVGVARVRYEPGRHRQEVVAERLARLAEEQARADVTRVLPALGVDGVVEEAYSGRDPS